MDLKTKKKIKNSMFTLFAVVCLLATILGASAETYVGNKVYIDTSKAYISAQPHTLKQDGIVTLKVISKQFTGDVNVVFGFNTDNAVPKGLDKITYIDNSYYHGDNDTLVEVYDKQYNNIGNLFNSINYDYDGMNKWYYATNLPVIAGTEYELELEIDIIEGNGKYDVAIYPSSYGTNIGQAIADNNFFMLDPYWTTNEQHDLENGLLAYWDLADNSATETDKHGSYDLTVVSASYDTGGILSTLYTFDGTDDTLDMSSDAFDGSGDLTINAWVQYTQTGQMVIFDKDTSATATNRIAIMLNIDEAGSADNGNMMFFLRGTGTDWSRYSPNVNPDLDDGEWHMITVTTVGGSEDPHIFIDGLEKDWNEGQNAYTGNDYHEDGKYPRWGSDRSDANDYNGNMTGMGLWNRVLSDKEIMGLYNNGQGIAHPFNYYNDGANHHIVAYYTFDNESIYDYTINENDLTVSGTPAQTTGKVNGAIDFDGSTDKYAVTDVVDSSALDEATICAWLNVDDVGDIQAKRYAPIGFGTTSHGEWWRIRWTTDAIQEFQILMNDGTDSMSCNGDIFVYDTWYHVCGRFQDGQAEMFINGASNCNATDANVRFSDMGNTLIDDLTIGWDDDTTDKWWDGFIDEVGVWSRHLNNSEISDLYASGSPNVTQQYPIGNDNNLIARLERSYEPNIVETGNITFSAGTIQGRTGVWNGGLDFTDTSSEWALLGSDLHTSDTIGTVSIWAYRDEGDDGSNDAIWGVQDSSSTQDFIYMYHIVADDTISVFARVDNVNKWMFDTDAGIPAGQWNHILITQDGVEPNLYVNGEDVAITFTTSTDKTVWFDDLNPTGTADTELGRYVTGAVSNYYDGGLDEFRFYDTVLNTTEIEQLYENNNISGDETHRWTLDGLTDQHNSNVLTANGDIGLSTSTGWDLDGTDDYISFDSLTGIKAFHIKFENDVDITASTGGMPLMHWDTSNSGKLMWFGGLTGNFADEMFTMQWLAGHDYYWTTSCTGSTITGGVVHNITITYDESISNYVLYFDGNDCGASTKYGSPSQISSWSSPHLGRRSANYYDGKISEFKVWGRTLSTEDANYIDNGTYNTYNFNSITPPAGAPANYTILLQIILPLLNSWHNSNVKFNYTADATNSLGNVTCSAKFDGVAMNATFGNGTTYTDQWTSALGTTNVEEQRNFNVTCWDNAVGGASNVTASRNYYYDDIAPRFTSSTYNGTSTILDAIWINNTFEDYNMDSVYTQLETKYNHTNSSLSGNYTYYHNLDITEYGIGTWYVWGNATDDAGNYIDYNTSFTINPDANFLTIRAMNYLGITPLTLATIWENHTNTTQIANPFQKAITDYLDKNTWNLSITFNMSDYASQHVDYNGTLYLTRHDWEHNITMSPSQLVLAFYQSGSPYSSKGFIADVQPKRFDFFNSTVVAIQQELAVGYVHVRFGDNSSGNWTQYYEYINDETEHITEDLEILQNADTSIHVQALGNDRVPLDDVKVRVQYMQYTLNNWTNGTLLGQRLTDGDGQTFFVADSTTQLLFTFTKNGYDPVDVPITVGDEEFTRTSPLQVFMAKSTTGVTGDVWMWSSPSTMTNTTSILYIMLLAQDKDRVQVQTDYMVTQGAEKLDLTPYCDSLDRCQYSLLDGTHFDNDDNVTIHVYIDNVYWGNRTTYQRAPKTSIFEPPSIDQKILAPILLIALILVTAGMSLRFRSRNVGVGTWTAGSLLISLISPAFTILAIITLLGLLFKLMYTVIKE